MINPLKKILNSDEKIIDFLALNIGKAKDTGKIEENK